MNMVDRPFAPPIDIELDLPAPPSVNLTRRVDWKQRAGHNKWERAADASFLAAKCREYHPLRGESIPAAFELTVILSERHTKMDLDNCLKSLIDWLRRVDLIIDDSPKYMRRLVVEWGNAPQGCRVILKPREPN
jgi:Holliday junction resolvase RusA-like endonuclease